MGETKKRIYEALVAGAASGLQSTPLYAYVAGKVPKSDNKRVIRAAFRVLRDPDMTDPTVVKAICSLAVERRLIDLGIVTESIKSKRKNSSMHTGN